MKLKIFNKKKKYLVRWCCSLHTAGALVEEVVELNEDEEWAPCGCAVPSTFCEFIELK